MDQLIKINTVITITTFIMGTAFGSFLSVVLHRFHDQKKGIIIGRSACPHCQHPLKNRDLMPLISYLLLRGKCRYCEKKIGLEYFILELAMGIISVLLLWKFPFLIEKSQVVSWPNLAYYFLYFFESWLFLGIFFYDLKYLEIPDLFLVPLIVMTLLSSIIMGKLSLLSLLIAAIIAVGFFGGQILVSKGRWLGEGDLYLAIAMAFLFGWEKLLLAIVLTYFIGAAISVGLLVFKKVNSKSKIPFAPFMVGASFITLFFGNEILQWYFNLLSI